MILYIIYIILILLYFITLYFVLSTSNLNNIKNFLNNYLLKIFNINKSNNFEKYENNNEMEFAEPTKFYKLNQTSFKNFFNFNSMFYSDNYNNDGYNKEGYNRNGYNKNGYNKYGFNVNGYNKKGYNLYGYDENGLNKDGYNIAGYKLDTETNRYYNKNGYDKNGYNKYGYDENGYDKYGYNKDGINQYGFDISGVNTKLKQNFIERTNEIFGTFPFNRLSSEEIEKRNKEVNLQLLNEDILEQELKDQYNVIDEETCTNGLPNEFNKYGCDLFNYYNLCKECVKKGDNYFLKYEPKYCPNIYSEAECEKYNFWKKRVICVENDENNQKPDNYKCINPPSLNGFGCYSEIDGEYSEPINHMSNNYNYICNKQYTINNTPQ